jgi:ribonucleoside-diphosphate reductase alpha chain
VQIRKRNGKLVEFDELKIIRAIEKAMAETKDGVDRYVSMSIAKKIKEELEKQDEIKSVEDIQDMVEVELMKVRPDVAKKYILYREKRAQIRQNGWEMTDLQRDIFKNKYEHNNEGFFNFVNRVAYIAKLIVNKKFLPAGRVLAGRGLQNKGIKVTYSNCYVIPAPDDNLESIFDTAKYLARTFSYGGGCGIDISKLRPKGAKVNNAAKESTGAVSFMELFSTTTGLISQKGRRRQ